MRKIVEWTLTLITTILLSKISFGQNQSGVFTDTIFKSNISTVQLYADPLVLSDPVITLNAPTQLHLAFDDLNGEKKEYYFSVTQCNYDWSPSELSIYDYVSGFTEQEIRDYRFSYGTHQTFTHYEALFPSPEFRITKSGNYILKVYEDDNPEQLLLTRRFIVVNNMIDIASEVTQADDVRYDRTYQQVHFSVLHHGMDISNAFSEINILLLQNFRWDKAIMNLQPQFVRPGQLDYMHTMNSAFPAGKEFRDFDTRTLAYKTDRVQNISEENGTVVITLLPDQSRGNAQYFSHRDINGKFIPGTQDYNDEDVRADYVWVKFSLPVDYPFKNGRIFLLGKFTDWHLQNVFRMQYNATSKAYEVNAYLKQGYYEYEYYFQADGNDTNNDSSSLLEGNSYETENTYQIFVYYRPFGSRYDQVIGYKPTDTFNR